MSSTPVSAVTHEQPPGRRVRHQARDAAVLMAFSVLMSLAFAVGLLLLAPLGR